MKYFSRRECRRKNVLAHRLAFTLVEIMIAIFILSIVAAISLPEVQSHDSQVLRSATQKLAADLRLARSNAIQYGTTYSVKFDFTNGSYEITHTGSGNPPPLKDPLRLKESVDGRYIVDFKDLNLQRSNSSDIRFRDDQSSANLEIQFNPQGSTGPTRVTDTVIFLKSARHSTGEEIQLTISWVTGQIWIE